ncbi:hypothetical protein [Oleidesulfovibrio alaskensis]|jgi:hypothetical protein|uniref:hypothetical protein n=1 Tax=Oleidesulfovibrio alaskensis TaxID=58180 RepID=UPI000482F86B|nr:hypothetical protein [Oleidesulfovibrio alaskensis]
MHDEKPTEARTQELMLLERMDAKLDALDKRMDGMDRRAASAGAVAGGVAGGITGALVASSIAYIKATLGW